MIFGSYSIQYHVSYDNYEERESRSIMRGPMCCSHLISSRHLTSHHTQITSDQSSHCDGLDNTGTNKVLATSSPISPGGLALDKHIV